ncbi:hypothetical protein DW846_02430 [Ruminococcus sp. AM36-2AA]|nr:hypothetical protein DW851_02425 [Ruminococcus sp. AM36-5]RGH62472.1 hypothetical protein DW846_02430 [Ruminococcus sp. AM36-2AA]
MKSVLSGMDLDTAGKWFGRLNQENGKTIISEDIFSDIFSQLFGELGEDTIKKAIAKGTASKGFKGALSAGISGFAGGLAGIGESIGTVGTGLVSFLGSIWPLLAVGGGIFAGIKGYQALNDKFTLTKGMADKHYSQSTQEYANNQSELESLQSQRDTNQERIYELRAKENQSPDEKAELSQLQEENNLLDSQVAIKEKSVDVSKLKAANDAKTKLEKKGYQKNYKKEAYDNQDKTSINDLDEASEMIDYLNQLKSEYKDRVQKIADEGREPSWIEQKGLDSTKKKIDSLESDVADKVTEISDTAKSMKNDDGSLIDEKFKDTVASADAVVQKYLNSTDSTTATSDKMNNIFALSQFSDLKDKLIAAGKSGGTDAIQKMIDDTDGLKDAMNNAGLTADDLKDSIMSIADPDAKNLEGIKENLEDIFGKDGLGQSDFFKGKTDEELENFWDYLQDNNYNPKQMNWNEETTKKNFEAAQEAKKKTPEESATFASKFKNAAEDTATDIDTVTDNFQSDMKNIQSAMESVTNGTFQNSDMADLIQQFPELSNASGDLKDNLQDLAMNKGAEAIGKIRDSVKDVTDPKQLAQADKYVQSIMDTMDMSDFDVNEADVKDIATKNIKKNADKWVNRDNASKKVSELMEKYSGNEDAMKAIVQLSMDPSMADASIEEWESKIEDQEIQIKINADTKELDNLSKSMTRLQTDASNTQTDMSNKSAFNQKINKDDYDALIKNGDAQIKNYDEQIAHYKNLQKILKENNIDAESTEQWKQWQDNIDAAQQSIENMKASQAEWGDAIKNLPITDITNLSSAITTAMSEMQSDTGLTTDSVKNLATQFSDLGDINIDSLYTRTAKGLQLNTDRLQDYMEQQNDFVNSDFENKVKEQKQIVEDAFKAYQNGDQSLANYTAEQNALDELLNRRNQYFARYQEAQEQFTDFQKMINAENAANAGDEYTTAKSKLDELKELYDNNLIGTEKFKKGAAYFSQNGFEDPENFIENYNHLKKYYTDDSSGPQKFLEDLNKKGLATYETLANGQKQWAYSFNDVKDAADQMGMRYESFQSILGRLSDYGFVNNLVTSTQDGEQQIDELTDDLITEKNKLSKLKANGATDQAIQDQENVVDQLESKISGVNQAVTDYANGETDRKVQDLKEAKQIIKDSKEAYDEAMKSGDTDLAQKLRKNIQDTAKDNNIELTPELNIDEKALDKQIDNLQSEAREKSVQKYKDIQDQLHNGQTEWTDSEDFNAADAITKLEQAQSENAEGFNNLVSNMKKYNLSDLESMIFDNGAYESEDQGLRDMEDQIQGFAESIGLTTDQANMLVPILEAMGTLDISPKVDNSELEKTVTDTQTAEQTLEETTGKQYNFDFNTTDLDTIQKQVDQVKKDIEDTYLKRDENGNVIRDENGIPTYDYSAPGAKETAQIYDASIKQQQQAEYQTSALGQSTSSDEVVKAAQDYMTAKNAMDVETQKYNLGMENKLREATDNATNAMNAYAEVADKNGNPLETDLKNIDPQKLEDQLLGVTDKDLKVKVEADTSDAENDIQSLENLEGSSITINADVSTNGGVEELQDSLASIPQGVSTTVTCDVEGESDVDNLESSMESIPDNTPVTIDCHVENQDQLDQINQKADELNANGKQIKINATVGEVKTDGATSNTPINVKGNVTEVSGNPSGTVDIKGNVTKISGNPSGTVDVKGNVTSVTGNPSGTVNVKGNITGITNEDAVKGKANYTVGHSPKKVPDASGKANFGLGKHPEKAPDIWGTAHYTGDFPTSAPTLSGTVVYHAQILGAPSGAKSVATGTMLSPAHASGTAYNVLNMKRLSPAHAGGNVAIKHNEQALVNEVGTESIVRNGVWSLLPGGAHLENLKQGDIVFSASQTKDLLEHGRTAGHARAYAEGTASLTHAYARSSAANGGGAFGGVRTRTTTSNQSSSSNNSNNNNALQTIADNTDSIAGSSQQTADNTSNWEDPWKNAVDWFERYSTRIDNKLDLNSAISDNYQGNKSNKKNPFSIATKNSTLDYSIDTIKKEIPNYQKQRDYYAWQAEAYGDKIGLSQDLRKLVQEGKIQDIEIYDEDTKSKIEAYQTWYDKVHSVESSIEDLKSKEADLWNQKFSNITDRYDALKGIYSGKNDILSATNDYRKETGQSESYKSVYANNIRAQRTNQIKQNAITAEEIKKYQAELRSLGKEYGTQSTIYKEAQSTLLDLNKEYQEGKTAVRNFTNQLNELKLKDLQNVIDRYDNASDKQSSYRDWKDATHFKGTSGVTQNDLLEGIKTNDKLIDAISARRDEVQRQMLGLSTSSDDYRTLADELAQLDERTANIAKNNAELRQQATQLRTDQYDKAIDKLERITTDCENIQSMMDSDTFLSDDGSLTTNGLTNIALENQSIQTNQKKIATLKQELAEVQQMYDNHWMTEEQFLSQSQQIISDINSAAKDISSSQQNLIDTYINQITKENEYLQDNISKRKEALEAKKDYYDYDKTIKNKTKDINVIKAQIAALEGTTNAVAKAKLEQLKADLVDKQEDLEDTKYDHKIDMESKGYDNLADQADKALDSTTQAVKTNADMQKSVIDNMLKEVQGNYKDVYDNITNIVKDSGAQISKEFDSILKNIGNGKGNFTVTVTSKAKSSVGKTKISNAPGVTGRGKTSGDKKVRRTAKDGSSANNAADENGTDRQATQAVTATPKSISIGVGNSATVKIGFKPTNATYKDFTYEVSKKGIVSISKGKSSITVKGTAVGSVKITIKGHGAGCKSTTVSVKVLKDGAKHTTIAKNVAKSMRTSLDTNDVTKILNATSGKKTVKEVESYVKQYVIQNKNNNVTKTALSKWFKALPAFKGDVSKVTGIVTKHLAQKGKKATVADIQKAASILGYKDYKNVAKWSTTQKNALVSKLKGYGFANGGIIRNLIPANMSTLFGDAIMKNGDTGLISARQGETVLTEKFTNMLEPTVTAMNAFTDMYQKMSAPNVSSVPTQQQNIFQPEYNINITGMDLSKATELKKVIRGELNNHDKALAKEFKKFS